jgi:hypothetical protein
MVNDGLRLVILFAHQVENRMFMRDFYSNIGAYFRGKKGLILHDGNDTTAAGLGMMSKKIGAGLSEEMITNVAFSGFQRNLISMSEQGPQIRVSLLKELYNTVDVVALNTLAVGEKYLKPDADFLATLIPQLENEFGTVRTLLFPDNPLSALGGTDPLVLNHPTDCRRWMEIFPEESRILNAAVRVLPCIITQPQQIGKLK